VRLGRTGLRARCRPASARVARSTSGSRYAAAIFRPEGKPLRSLTAVVVLLMGATSQATAQRTHASTVSLLAGPSSYRLSGTGTTLAVAAHLAWTWRPSLIVEPGITYLGYTSPFGDRATYLLPELSFQVGLRPGRVRPYFGAGIGPALSLGQGAARQSMHAVVGARVDLVATWGARVELRARSLRDPNDDTVDFMVGITRRLR